MVEKQKQIDLNAEVRATIEANKGRIAQNKRHIAEIEEFLRKAREKAKDALVY